MKIGNSLIVLKTDEKLQEPAAYVHDEKISLPKSLHGVVIQRIADYIIVRESSSDLYVKWDGKESFSIRVSQ